MMLKIKCLILKKFTTLTLKSTNRRYPAIQVTNYENRIEQSNNNRLTFILYIKVQKYTYKQVYSNFNSTEAIT